MLVNSGKGEGGDLRKSAEYIHLDINDNGTMNTTCFEITK